VTTYYRLFGRHYHYHLPGPKWLETGKALCGADLRRFSHYALTASEIPKSRSICRQCQAADDKRRALAALDNRTATGPNYLKEAPHEDSRR